MFSRGLFERRSEMKKCPEDFEELGVRMSNFDHSIDEGTEEELKLGKYCCTYAAWNFNGQVWWDGTNFLCGIWRFKSHIDTIEAPTLRDLMLACSEKYGSD
jgi:hypothetical protein